MKTTVPIFFIALFLAVAVAGCGQPAGQPKYQTYGLGWWPGYTNLELDIIYQNVETKTNITSLEHAVNILGQYGYQVVAVTGDTSINRTFYLQRQYRGQDNCSFCLMPPN